MEELEQKSLETFGHSVKVWKRYVDDTFVVVKKEHVEALHQHLNDQFTGVSFTLEEEKEGSLAFLDVEVKRCQDGSVKTAGFRKVTHTDKYLGFNSHQGCNFISLCGCRCTHNPDISTLNPRYAPTIIYSALL